MHSIGDCKNTSYMRTLKLKYFIYFILLHVAIGVLTFLLLEEQLYWFMAIEVVLLISLSYGIYIYYQFSAPLNFVKAGKDAINDRDFQVKFRLTGAKEMDQLIEVYNAMIDNIRIERTQLQEQHYFLTKLIEASPNGIIILDFDEHITEVNTAAARQLQVTKQQLLGQHIESVAEKSMLLHHLKQLNPNESTLVKGPNQEQYRCEVARFIHRGFPRKFILIQELSREILVAEKQAYGKVIRMMAHEVNNSIGAINSILNSTLDYYEDEQLVGDETITQSLQLAVERNQSLQLFMQNFASVVRLPKARCAIHPLQSSILHATKLMQHQAQEHQLTIVHQLPAASIHAFIDPQLIEQVLVNILKNAIDAGSPGGQIICQLNTSGVLRISDNGSGIAADVQGNLFSPFFSTKPHGQGIGLTLTKEILLKHKAGFSLKTQDDGWTVFEIQFGLSPHPSLEEPTVQISDKLLS